MNQTDSFEQALAHCRRFRAQLPAIYNIRRQFDRPIPSLTPVSDFETDEHTDDEMMQNNEGDLDLANENESEIDVFDDAEVSIDDNFSMQNDTRDLVNGHNQSNDGDIGSNAETKHTLHNVSLDLNDEIAINALFNDESSQPDANSDEAEMTLGDGETAEKVDGKTMITKVIDDDVVMTYAHGEKPNPLKPLYRVKLNDPISENELESKF